MTIRTNPPSDLNANVCYLNKYLGACFYLHTDQAYFHSVQSHVSVANSGRSVTPTLTGNVNNERRTD